MRALLQRTTGAQVRVDDEVVGAIGPGLVVLLGVGPDDDEAVAEGLARRVTELRIFDDAAGRTNLSLTDVGGAVLVAAFILLDPAGVLWNRQARSSASETLTTAPQPN